MRAADGGAVDANYGQPERLLIPEARSARSACSAWSFVAPDVGEMYSRALAEAIESDEWDAVHGHLREQQTFQGSLVLIRSVPSWQRRSRSGRPNRPRSDRTHEDGTGARPRAAPTRIAGC